MRTTVDLPDETFRRLKAAAAERGVTLKVVLRVAVENELRRMSPPAPEHRLAFPLLDSEAPGTLNLTNAEIEDLLT